MDGSSGQGLVEEMEIAYRRKACARMICFALPWERLGPDSRGRAVALARLTITWTEAKQEKEPGKTARKTPRRGIFGAGEY